jgi:pentatricopeptide repeat protein
MNRRDFLKTSIATTAAATLPFSFLQGCGPGMPSDGEMNILNDSLYFIPERFREGIKEVIAVEDIDGYPVGNYSAGVIKISRKKIDDFARDHAMLQSILNHEHGHHVHTQTLNDIADEFYAFENTLELSPGNPDLEDFAIHFDTALRSANKLELDAYYEGDDLQIDKQDTRREKYEWLRDNVFRPGELKTIHGHSVFSLMTHRMGISTLDEAAYQRIIQVSDSYLNGVDPHPKLVPLFIYARGIAIEAGQRLRDEKIQTREEILNTINDSNSIFSIETKANLARAYAKDGQFDKAIQLYKLIIRWARNNNAIGIEVENMIKLRSVLIDASRKDEANEIANSIKDRYPDTSWSDSL